MTTQESNEIRNMQLAADEDADAAARGDTRSLRQRDEVAWRCMRMQEVNQRMQLVMASYERGVDLADSLVLAKAFYASIGVEWELSE